ncbi:MAG TPA: S8 family serine peptidase [Planctomycetota bacterium]|nr:S8 family serine peptidase [Planctomycetota bacterium]
MRLLSPFAPRKKLLLLLLPLGLGLCCTFGFVFWHFKPSHPAAQHICDRVTDDLSQSERPHFFDREAAAAFESSVVPPQRPFIIHLNARSFCVTSRLEAGAPPNTEWSTAYVQFTNHPSPDEIARLKNAGVELIRYVTDHAWLARGRADAFDAVASWPNVRGFAAIDPADKLHPTVFAGAIPDYARRGAGSAAFNVLALPNTTLDALQAELQSLPDFAGDELALRALAPSVLGPRFEIVLNLSKVRALASAKQVAFVSFATPRAAPRDATTDSSSNIAAVRDQGPKVDGSGITVAVRDVGKPDMHVDFAPRMQYIDSDGDPTYAYHATAVVGQIASNGSTQPAAKGVAPNSNVLIYSLQDSDFGTADMIDAGTRGARMSNHSYGPSGLTTYGDYQPESADFDAAMNAHNLLAFLAGNEESDATKYNHIDFFVGTKNGLCLEASSSSAMAGNPSAIPPIAPSDGIASFAKYGPMNDGRIKPDLVAFGVSVTMDQGTNGTGTLSGTSFSTAVATGVSALVLQHYKSVYGAEPSAAMTKTLLCESATDLGQPGPDAIYGFGIINAQEAVRLIDLKVGANPSPFAEGSLANGQAQTQSIAVPAGAPLLKATLCWMDVAGDPTSAKALVNDLDLTLTDPNGVTYYPFSLDPANPSANATASGPNRVDPIEQIAVNNPVAGTWTATINAFSVPSGSQAYAFCANFTSILAPMFTSGPMATPSTAGVGQTVSFSATASGTNVSYAWNFGDGTTSSGPNVIHAYAAADTYTASVVASDSTGSTIGSVQVIVNAPIVGTGNDSDGDGFSDDFENAVGTNPNDPSSTPFGGAPAPAPQTLTLATAYFHLNFAKSGADMIRLHGTLNVPAGFAPAGQIVYLDVGGVVKSFTLNDKGLSKTLSDTLKIVIRKKSGFVPAQTSSFTATLTKGTFSAQLADEQLTGDADASKAPRTVVVTLLFNNSVLTKSQSLKYTAKKGKFGIAH